MNNSIRNLEPKALWENFSDLNAVPRASKKEEKVIAFMLDFGKKLGLETFRDEVGNVIIKKPATQGMENRKTIVLQSHLDMVHQKNNDTVFDFDTEGIKMKIDGDWVKAEGTTLGADNGIGVASIMAILESNQITHPALEALFTIDEETGMTGAMGLKGGLLEGEILLNLDTEEDDEIDIGCAGGVDVTACGSITYENTPEKHIGLKITLKGLQGGHSGMDIHKGLGNANKLMNRLLFSLSEKFDIKISELNGGGLRNAIPRESVVTLAVSEENKKALMADYQALTQEIKHEFSVTEPQLSFVLEEVATPEKTLNTNQQKKLLRAIYTAHNGVYAMSKTMENLVETSNNIAKITIKDGKITIHCLTRSSVETAKFDLANSLKSAFELADLSVSFSGSYPGWEPNVNASILKVLKENYQALFNETPSVVACHAGLECGILGTNYPKMEMISFGPTIKGAHSPEEKVSISSVQKFWKFLLEILKNIPKK